MAKLDLITSSTRPASPAAGKAYFETDTNKIIVWDGSAWTELVSDNAPASFANDYSVDFDGTNDYIQTSNSFLSMFQSSFSISAWAKLNNTSGLKFLIALNVNGTSRYQLYTSGSTLYSFIESGDKNGDTLTSATSSVSFTDWFHVCATFEQSGTSLIQKMYLNGSLADSGTTSSMDLANFSTTQTMLIGARLTSGQYPVDGLIDEVSFFDSVLSATDISSSLIDTSGSNPVPADISSLSPIHWWRMGDGDDGAGNADGTVVGADPQVYDMAGSNHLALKNGPTFSSDVPV